MRHYISILFLAIVLSAHATGGKVQYNSIGVGNPIIPGYFADPTIRKFGDMYYLYSTTDGNGGGKGPSQVWVSKDFVNWTMMPMNWPTSLYYWAPDVMEYNNKYYLYYCQPSCEVYCGISDTPRGPWENIFGRDNEKALIPDRLVTGAITLDGQTFIDDDGSVYIYFGTWGIYEGFGCGVAKLSSDLKTVVEKKLIPNTEIKDFFEAPYVIKKNGVYYLTYSSGSCHDETYRVQYATSTVGPMGPFVYAANNPILVTSADKTIHGPGHHGILEEGDDYYIVYHRHNIPNSTRGMHRQVAADKLVFMPDKTIQKVEPSHEGIGALNSMAHSYINLALGKKVKASSYYDESFKPEYAVDDNNATLWRPKTCGKEWIEIDLGNVESIQRIWTQFEYPTTFYQYVIETSLDGKSWTVFSDKSSNLLAGSPMADYGNARARYVKLTFMGAEKNGVSAALWNIKIFNEIPFDSPQLLIDLATVNLNNQVIANDLGMLGGCFRTTKGQVTQREVEGCKAFVLSENTELESNFEMPSCLSGTTEYTLFYKQFGTLTDILKDGVTWLDSQRKLLDKHTLKTSQNPAWHTIAITSDGKREWLFIDGQKQTSQTVRKKQQNKQKKFCIIAGMVEKTIADIRIYNWCRDIEELKYDATIERKHRPAIAERRKGLLMDINAAESRVGDAITTLKNSRGIEGRFIAQDAPLSVVLKKQRIAFEFDGNQRFDSNFGLPETMEGNSPYSIAAWIMNPNLSEAECILDVNQAGGELEKIVFGYGKDSNSGIISHHAGYEDMGLQDISGNQEWIHLVATYDGFKERIYINGNMVKEKDILLRLPLSEKLFIGKDFAGERPYTGWLSSLSLYDIPLSSLEVSTLYKKETSCNVLFAFQPSMLPYESISWQNEGVWRGQANSIVDNAILDVEGKIVIGKELSLTDMDCTKKTPIGTLLCSFLPTKGVKKLIAWDSFSLAYDGSKKKIRIQSEERLFEIDISHCLVKQWMQLVFIPRKNLIYVNGSQISLSESICLSVPNTSMTIGSEKCYITQIAAYSDEWSDLQVKETCQNIDLNRITEKIRIKVRIVCGTAVRFFIESNNTELQYYFYNQTTGNSSGWTNLTYFLDESVQMNRTYHYIVKAKDRYGNVVTGLDKSVTIDNTSFNYIEDNFNSTYDFVNKGCGGIDWKGVAGFDIPSFKIKSENGKLELNSAGTAYKYDRKEDGPYIYQEVSGDFMAQIEIAGFSGYEDKKAVGLNEGGLLIMPVEDSNYWIMHLSAFPYWSAGNLLTYLTKFGRPQYANKKGWNFDRLLQVERCGNYFFFRTSIDGETWTDMPHSPLFVKDLNGKPIKVGPYQATNAPDNASIWFKKFKLWQTVK